MSTKETEDSHTEGPAWKTVARCETFEAANKKRAKILSEEGLQVKVHRQGPRTKKYYAVKTRTDPSSTLENTTNKKQNSKKAKK